jgi:OPA family sugar phosphate sensor protein UhpC-like MFS transporter
MAEVNSRPPKNLKYEFWRYRIFIITWLAYAAFYLTRMSFSVAKIGIEQDPNFHLSKSVMGVVDGVYLAAYAVGQFIWGMFGDRFGTRIVILIGMFASVIAGFGMGASSTTLLLGIFFCIQGLCQSTGWAPLAKNISYFFSQRERGVVMGWWCTHYAVGGTIAVVIAGYIGDYFDNWRYAFYGPAALLFGVWVLFLLLQKNRPEDIGLPPIEEYHGEKQAVLDVHDKPQEEPEGSWKTIFAVLKNRMVLFLGLVYFCLKPTRYAVLFWSAKYVNEKLGTGMGESASISMCFQLAGPLGILFGGYMSDKVFGSRRMPISVICLFLLGAVLFSFSTVTAYSYEHFSIGLTKWVLRGLFFAIGFLLYVPDSLVSGTAPTDFGTKKGASTASGFINGCGSVAAISGGSLAGWVAENWNWNVLFIALGITICLAGIVLLPKWNALPATANDKPAPK